MAAFIDMRVSCASKSENKTDLKNVITMAAKLGYDTVIIDQFMEDMSVKTSKKGKEKPQVIKPPEKLMLPESMLNDVRTPQGKRIKQMSRFSMVLSDAAQVVRLQKEENIQAYDILSVQPINEKLFHLACKELEVDIISLNMDEKLPFFTKRQQVGAAIERGIHFEISYKGVIKDSTARRNIIANANKLMSVCKGKNIILSSNAQKAMDLRGPYDVANLGLLFGMNEAQAKNAVSGNCRAAVLHAAARKSHKGIIEVMKAADLPQKDQWKVVEIINKNNSESDDSDESSQASEEETDTVPTSDEPPLKKTKTDVPT